MRDDIKKKMVKKKLTKKSKLVNQNKRLTLVVSLLKQGLRPVDIAKEWNCSKSYISKLIRPLKAKGLIKHKGCGVWKVSSKLTKFSLGTRTKPIPINLHALQINFPILEGKINDKNWIIKEKLNNWLPKYTSLKILNGLTVKNNNNKSLTIFVKSRDVLALEDINNLAYKIRKFLPLYFRKEGVILDDCNCRVSNLNIATEDKHSKGMLGRGEKFELDLNKPAEKIFPKDDRKAKAWLDTSPYKFTVETNDLEWKRAYLRMPLAINGLCNVMIPIMQGFQDYNKNIKQHLAAIQDIRKYIKELRDINKKRK